MNSCFFFCCIVNCSDIVVFICSSAATFRLDHRRASNANEQHKTKAKATTDKIFCNEMWLSSHAPCNKLSLKPFSNYLHSQFAIETISYAGECIRLPSLLFIRMAVVVAVAAVEHLSLQYGLPLNSNSNLKC